MSHLIIGCQRERGLGFDLAEVLDALGPRVARSAWAIEGLKYVSRDETDIPVLHGGDGARVLGTELLSSLPNLLQVIDGEFRAFKADGELWVILRAVDSSWWEVVSDDSAVLSAIRDQFLNVDEQP
ncbi:MAG TPA: hypothetical protein VLB76_04420 [Thermoanaerobaculia bacterium]|jgi:hypothetical protein|nr:hypothetical protein [Thermoanaerobaculia bacterium]